MATTDFPPLGIGTRSGPRRQEVVAGIKEYILRNQLKPGDLLPTEAELCDAVGASRSSVREAVKTLSALDIVEVRHGHGTYVGGMSLAALVESLAFRGLLSGEADMQGAMRRELESPNPDLVAYRVYATTLVSLSTEPLRDLMLRSTPEVTRAGAAASGGASPAEQVAIAGRATETLETPPGIEAAPPAPPLPAPPCTT